MKRITTTLAAVLAAAALLLSLAGCRPQTVTEKYRSWTGLYFVCTGPSWAPCVKGDVWRVSKSQYDEIQVGQTYQP